MVQIPRSCPQVSISTTRVVEGGLGPGEQRFANVYLLQAARCGDSPGLESGALAQQCSRARGNALTAAKPNTLKCAVEAGSELGQRSRSKVCPISEKVDANAVTTINNSLSFFHV